ncbi:DUF6624 domain-containing protein [Chitinophaga sp. Hz27]|uniref:DUF6624 domain-containing protein n=1 Tax=Chitinophaga sp. Hz27 TaxID=3347169 RepID=UPI0035E15211
MKKLPLIFLLLACNVDNHRIASLRAELNQIYDDDQRYREQLSKSVTAGENIALWKKQERLDAINLKRVKVILDSMGNPGKSVYGENASTACFLVIQHATLAEQEKYLPLFTRATESKELEWSMLVKMIDRVKLEKEGKQLYGTQYMPIKDSVTGYNTDKLQLAPIEDEANVEK